MGLKSLGGGGLGMKMKDMLMLQMKVGAHE